MIPSSSFKDQGTVDWPSANFEILWGEVASAAPPGNFTSEQSSGMAVISRPNWGKTPVGAWVAVTGRLEQRTPLGTTHPDGEEWFVRPEAGDPIAAYVMTTLNYPVGSFVSVLGRDAGMVRLTDRQGTLHEYPALVGRPFDRSLAKSLVPQGGGILGGFPVPLVSIAAVVVLIGAWIAIRLLVKRGRAGAMSAIHAVADRARSQGQNP